jgi:hypothetical protein
MNQTVTGCPFRFAVLGGAAFIASFGGGCSRELQPAEAPTRAVAAEDEATCQSRLVKSIWQGEDVGGPECRHYLSSDGQAPMLHGSRVQTVCERAHIRSILTGEASTSFTLRACAPYAQAYPETRTRRTCRRVARAYPRDLTDVQEALCRQHLAPSAVAEVAPSTTSRPTGAPGALARTLAPRDAESRERLEPGATAREASAHDDSARDAALQEAEARGTVWSNSAGTVRWWSVIPAAPSRAAKATIAPVAALAPEQAAERAPEPVVSKDRCEDRYVESIWKGRDVSGPECAAYVAYDGATPDYDASRIASVCLGAEKRALRSDVPMTVFTLQACLGVLRDRWSREPQGLVQSTAGADWNTDPADTSTRRGLSDSSISSIVEASWPSIGRDCSAVAPLSASRQPAPKLPVVVTLTVGGSGQVRSVSARAAGNRELEMCIESSVRSWSFPPAVGTTVISIPMSFNPAP